MTSQSDIVLSLLHRYALAVDTQRWDLFDAVFTQDATIDVGPVWTGLAAIKEIYAGFYASLDASCHSVSNPVWTFEDGRATVLSSVHAMLVRHDVPGGDMLQNWGWFEDELVLDSRRGWRIARRLGRLWRMEGNRSLLSGPGGAELPFDPMPLKLAAADGQLGLLNRS